MSSYTLDDIRAAADRKYGSTDIQVGTATVRLVNPLRLSKDKRAALTSLQDEMTASSDEGEETSQEEIFQRAIRLVAQTAEQAELLIGQVGDDLAMLAEVFHTYTEGTQMGEASSSAA